jgi:CubicO group peptidase (beta-lactamase class C family)
MKTALCTLTILVASLAASLAIAEQAPPAPRYSAADEAVYMQRFGKLQEAFRLGLGLESYEPLEPVPGAPGARLLPTAEAGQRSLAPAALADAREYAARNNSLALIVWRKGRVEEASYFRGATAGTTFPSRSLAKPMTAVAVGRALALGRIRSLDQPVADFFTEWRGDPRRSGILVRHLLDMRSGLLPQNVATTAEDILNRAYLHPRHEEVILHDYPAVDDPGTRYEYNNATSELVALLIERSTGRRYAEFLSTEILKPLGAPGGEVWVNRPGGLAHSGCCLMLPPEAWLRLGVLVMQDGVWEGKRLLPEGYVRQMQTATAQNPYYGLGLYVAGDYIARRGFANPARDREALRVKHSEPYLARDLVLFDGNANQVVYIIPSEQMVILRVGDSPPRANGNEWDNAFLPNTLMRGIVRRPGESIPESQPRN